MTIPPFHIAFPVHDIQAARDFYGGYGARTGGYVGMPVLDLLLGW